MNIRIKPLSAALAALFLVYNHAAASPKVPAGFEDLAKGQVIWLDVSLYGRSLGLFQAKVDLDNVFFLQPDQIAAAIQEKYNDSSAPQLLLRSSLNRPLKRNGNLACSTSGNAPGCDFIETDAVAVIYDENYGRISLFLGKAYLPEEKNDDKYYDVTIDSRNALVHQQNVNFVADQDYQSASVQGNGSLGVTENGFINVDWNWQGQRFRSDSVQQADVNNAYFRQDFMKQIYLQGGIMDSRDIFSNMGGNINLSQLPLGKIRGARIGSTLAWINRDNVVQGTPVTVFLSREARVDAYRDGQLLSSFYLRAGAQKLDTRTFPIGSYTVTLRIHEDNQLVRTETLPYTATGSAPLNTFQWFLQGGNQIGREQNNTDESQRVVQGGFRLPLIDTLSLTAGSTLLSNARYWESAADWSHGFSSGPIDGVLTSRISYLHGSEGSRGNIQQVNYNDGFSLSFYRSEMTAPDCNQRAENRYSYSGCYKSTSLMLSVPIAQWNASLGYAINSNQGRYASRRELSDDDIKRLGGAPWEQVYTSRSHSRTWQVGLSRAFTINDININTSINAFTRRDSSFDGVDSVAFLNVSLTFGSKRSLSSLGANWQKSQHRGDRLSYNAAYSRYTDDSGENELGASLYGVNAQTATASAYARMGGQYGNGMLTVSDAYDRTENHHRLSSSGNYGSSLVVDRTGLLWGRWGDGSPSSAIALSVDTPEGDWASRVNVSVDSAGQADVSGNSRTVFTVPAYRQSTFSVNESSSALAGINSQISKGAGSRTVFLTPGKVFSRGIEVTSHYTWLGRMTDENNQPLEGAIPLNVQSWTPLGQGGFTLETTNLLKTLYLMKENAFWQCQLKVKAIRDVVRWVGTTQCASTEMANLPNAEQKQVELMTAGNRHKDSSTVQNR
ncbi:TcfC E-set like domain-containing protein [Serratia sp. D1N4]